MKYRRIILAGGNGYIGTVLSNYYKHLAESVTILSRKAAAKKDNIQTIVWDAKTGGDWVKELEGADLLVNLCGKNVNCRYTAANRKEIVDSRAIPTFLLGKVITEMNNPPKVWINITSATIYRHAEDHYQDEVTGETGYGFSIDVCKAWEDSFMKYENTITRKIALRLGIVLGRHDGVFPRLLNLVKLGMGGKQGDGKQYISWIHEHDVAKSIQWVQDHEQLSGIINCTAPIAIQNHAMMKAIRKTYGIPVGLPAPEWLLEMGAVLIGTETELILKSRWVYPTRLLNSGYVFQFETAEHAIHDILSIRV